MKPAPFEYLRPGSIQETLSLLTRFGADARVLAGGQSLVPMLNRRLDRPRVLIDINAVPGLDAIRQQAEAWHLGACVRYRQIEYLPVCAEVLPLLAQAVPWIGNPAVRNRGTVGGSLAHADPVAELPACALCLDAHVSVVSSRGSRRIGMEAFIGTGTDGGLAADELLLELIVPSRHPDERYFFREIGRRGRDAAIAGIALRAHRAAQVTRVLSLVVFGAARRPTRVVVPFPLDTGSTGGDIARARACLQQQLELNGDPAYPAAVRLQMAATLVHRAFTELSNEYTQT